MTRLRFRHALSVLVATASLWGVVGPTAVRATPAPTPSTPPALYAGDTTSIVSLRSTWYGRYDQIRSYTPKDGAFTATGDRTKISVTYVGAGGALASLTIAPEDGQPLVAGPYDDVTTGLLPDPAHPWVRLTGFASTACDPAPARFDVLELAFEDDGSIRRLTFDTEETCSQNANVSVKTRVRIHGTDLFTASPGPRDQDRDGVDSTIDNCPLWENPDQADDDGDGVGDICDVEADPTTYLELDSDGPTEPVTKGQYVRLATEDGRFEVEEDGSLVRVLVGETDGPTWEVAIDAPLRAAGTTSTSPFAVRVRKGSAGCAVVAESRFRLHELWVGPADPNDARISVDFDVRCLGSTDWLHGQVRYRSTAQATPTNPTVGRVAGADRIETAIVASQSLASYGAGGVVLARSDSFADALAGTPLAAALNAPLLLTPSTGLDPRVLAEIRRVLPGGGTVHLLGGDVSLRPAVAQALTAAGYVVVRLAGADRYATAAAIARAVETKAGAPIEQVLLATGTNFPDGLSAGAAAAASRRVLRRTHPTAMPAATQAFLAAHPGVPVTAIGGQAASAAPSATKVVGADRYATAVATAKAFFPADLATVGVASGLSFPDALAGGVHAARVGGPLLLTAGSALPFNVGELLAGHVLQRVDLYGGAAVVSDTVQLQISMQVITGPPEQRIGKIEPPPPVVAEPGTPKARLTLPGLPEITDPVGDVLEQIACVDNGHGHVVMEHTDGVYLVDADRGCARVALRGTAVGTPAVSPDGQYTIVTNVHGVGSFSPTALWKVHLVTGAREQLTPPMSGVGGAKWSPDGEWILFRSTGTQPPMPNPLYQGGIYISEELWLMRPDGSDRHRIMPSDGWGMSAWSRDGKRIAVVLRNDDHMAVYDVDEGSVEYFPIPEDTYMADWSPDGTQLVFNAYDDGNERLLYLMDPDTGAYEPIARQALFPRWSPDGRWIAVLRNDHLTLLRPDGATGPELQCCEYPTNWSDDSRYLLDTGGGVYDMVTGETRDIAYPGERGPWPQASRWIPGTHTYAVIATGTGHYTP